MKCPKCDHPKSKVYRTERSVDGTEITRKRLCLARACGNTWTTVERRGVKKVWTTA